AIGPVNEVAADETEGVYKDRDGGETSAKGCEQVW
ncbi:hypothetical protein L917_19861, partial [Phytophthora nicotianae]